MTREARQTRCPETVLGWIPWYAEGGLTDREKGIVEAHAAECADCRAELDMIAGGPFEVDFELPDPDRVFGEITQRIHAEEAARAGGAVIPIGRARALSQGDLGKLERWMLDPSSEEEAFEEEARAREARRERTEAAHEASARDDMAPGQGQERGTSRENVIQGPWARSTAWAAAAALVLFLAGGLGGALLAPFGSDSASLRAESADGAAAVAVYDLASAPAPVEGLATEAVRSMIDVVFLDSASALEISNALRAVGVEIVSGPTNLGVYRLALTEAAAVGRAPSAADAAAIAARLASSEAPIALYAEPVR